jgi:magnesium transporter
MIKVRALLDGQQVEDVAMADLPAVRARQGTLVWVEAVSPSPEELATLGEEFGIHEVALEDLQVDERQRPKVEQYQEQILLVAYGALTARRELASEGAGYLLYVALDELVETFFPALDAIGQRVVDLEEAVLAGDTGIQARIFAVRKELITVRRVIGPMRDAMVVLLRRDLGIISHETQRYLQDVYDHLIRLSESVEDYQDVLAGTLDVNATMASNRVNTVARNLAAYAAIFAVVTMISGIYGMNFQHMPELGWRFGYGWALGLMVVGAGGLYIYFKRKGWL